MALELGLHGHRLESQTLIIIFTGQTEQSCRHRQRVSDHCLTAAHVVALTAIRNVRDGDCINGRQ